MLMPVRTINTLDILRLYGTGELRQVVRVLAVDQVRRVGDAALCLKSLHILRHDVSGIPVIFD